MPEYTVNSIRHRAHEDYGTVTDPAHVWLRHLIAARAVRRHGPEGHRGRCLAEIRAKHTLPRVARTSVMAATADG
ncbi:hypothetical protein GCM10010317_069000 [Streptomyces mirabilis]|nr:hypothetical protein GCM10010317_069000 [Streptomyces mirabilis]